MTPSPDDLKDAFSKFGTVWDVYIPKKYGTE